MEQYVPGPLRLAAALSWRLLVVAAAIALLALIMATLRLIILPTVIALILATAFVPPARWLSDRGLPRALATLAVILGAFLVVVVLFATMTAFFVIDFSGFRDLQGSVEQGVDRIERWIVDSPLNVSEGEVETQIQRLRERIQENSQQIIGGAFSGALILVEMLAGAALTIVILFFFVYDGRRMWRWTVGLFADEFHDDVNAIGERSWHALSGYLRGVVGVAFFDAVAIGIVLLILGVPFVVPLSLLIFFGAFVPIVGAFVTGFVAIAVALASQGAVSALIVLAANVTVQQVEGQVLQPLLVGRSVNLHPLAVLIAVSTGGVIWGIPGAFVAVPMTAVIVTTISYLVARGRHLPPREAVRVDPANAHSPDAVEAPAGGRESEPDEASDATRT